MLFISFKIVNKIARKIEKRGEKGKLDNPAPMVRVSEHGASSINLVARCWVKSSDYWTVNFDVIESVKVAFDKEGIEIPFNQLDVHVKND